MGKRLAILGAGHLGQQIAHYAISDKQYSQVVFFDDLKGNVEGAKSVGIQAVHVTGPKVIFDFFGHV